jgi:N-acetylglutamate synthase-like GNAT family acetyltransferase
MIRLAKLSDLKIIMDNLIRTNSDTFSQEEITTAEESISQLINQQRYYVSIRSGVIVGCAGFSEREDTTGVFVLNWIAVNPNITQKGIGTELYNFVEKKVKELGARMMILNAGSGEDNVLFYRKMGFTEVGRIPQCYGTHKDLIWYQKML